MHEKVYIVTGASGGIGGATCALLSERGAKLVVAGRDGQRLETVAARHGALAVPTEATDTAAEDALIERTLQTHGRLDGVAHCVGSVLLKPVHRTTDDEWHRVVSVNLDSAFYVLRAAARAMQQTGGAVVLCSTAAAQLGMANHEAIAAAKAGVEGLARAAAASYAARGIRVNVVAPGLVRTALTAGITGHEPSAQASLAMHPLRRFGEPDDVARAIAFLLAPAPER